jgi:hypothetical protein
LIKGVIFAGNASRSRPSRPLPGYKAQNQRTLARVPKKHIAKFRLPLHKTASFRYDVPCDFWFGLGSPRHLRMEWDHEAEKATCQPSGSSPPLFNRRLEFVIRRFLLFDVFEFLGGKAHDPFTHALAVGRIVIFFFVGLFKKDPQENGTG